MVVAAPTGSGKTGVLELAWMRLLQRHIAADGRWQHEPGRYKALYVAPSKVRRRACRARAGAPNSRKRRRLPRRVASQRPRLPASTAALRALKRVAIDRAAAWTDFDSGVARASAYRDRSRRAVPCACRR